MHKRGRGEGGWGVAGKVLRDVMNVFSSQRRAANACRVVNINLRAGSSFPRSARPSILTPIRNNNDAWPPQPPFFLSFFLFSNFIQFRKLLLPEIELFLFLGGRGVAWFLNKKDVRIRSK